MLRFRGEYIKDRKALHNQVRAEAGERCIRCFHPGGDTPSTRMPCDERCTHPRDATELAEILGWRVCRPPLY